MLRAFTEQIPVGRPGSLVGDCDWAAALVVVQFCYFGLRIFAFFWDTFAIFLALKLFGSGAERGDDDVTTKFLQAKNQYSERFGLVN